jgi:c-di-GMP-binding flagellar brake protein YcgR
VKDVDKKERRKHSRISSLNLLSYFCIDENDEIMAQGAGRTLNVSEGGILLETHTPIDPQHTVSLVIAMENELIDIRGKVVHNRTGKDGRFLTGIQFVETDESARDILKKFITEFRNE